MTSTRPTCVDRDNHRAGAYGCPSAVLDCQGIPVDATALDTAPVPAPRDAEAGVYSVIRTVSGCLARVTSVDRVPFSAESDPYGRGMRRPFGVWDFNTEEAGRVLVVTYESRGPLDRDARHYAAVFVGGDLVDGAGALDMARGPSALGAEIAWRAARHIADRPAAPVAEAPAQVDAPAEAEAPADVDQVAEAPAPADDDPANYWPHWSAIPQVHPLPADWSGGPAKWTPGKDVAKLVRDAVKSAFPGVKFSVTTDACTLRVRWTDGPLTDAVDLVVKPYAGQTFDGMTDSRSSVGDVLVIGRGGTRTAVNLGTDFVFTTREHSPELIESCRPAAAVMAGRELSADPSADWFPGDLADSFGVWRGMGNGRELLDYVARTRTPDMRGHGDDRPACGVAGAFGRTCELAAGHPYAYVHRDSYGRPFIGRPPLSRPAVDPAPVAQVDAPAEAPAVAEAPAAGRGFFDQGGRWIPQGGAQVAEAPAAPITDAERRRTHPDTATLHADVIAYRRRIDGAQVAEAPAQVDAPAPAGPVVASVDAVPLVAGTMVVSGLTYGRIVRAIRRHRTDGFDVIAGGQYTRHLDARNVRPAVVGATVCAHPCTCAGRMHLPAVDLVNLPRLAPAEAEAPAQVAAEVVRPFDAVDQVDTDPAGDAERDRARRGALVAVANRLGDVRADQGRPAVALSVFGELAESADLVDVVRMANRLRDTVAEESRTATPDPVAPPAADLGELWDAPVRSWTFQGTTRHTVAVSAAPLYLETNQRGAYENPSDLFGFQVIARADSPGEPAAYAVFWRRVNQGGATWEQITPELTAEDMTAWDGRPQRRREGSRRGVAADLVAWLDGLTADLVAPVPASAEAGAELARLEDDPADVPAEVPAVESAERWRLLGSVTAYGSDARGRMHRAMRRVHGLPDVDPAEARADGPALIAARDADPSTWAEKCAAYLAAYAVLMTEDGAGQTHAVEPEPADRPAPAPVPADAPAGPVAVADLVAGDRVHVVGIDQFGSPSHCAGFVQGAPSEVTVPGRTPSGRRSKDPKKARPALLVSLAETPNGWNGWRMVIVTVPGAMAERVTGAEHEYRPGPADLPHLVKPACSCGALEYAGACRQDMGRVEWLRHVNPPAQAAKRHTPAMLAEAEALGRRGYAEGWPSAPGACGEIVDMVRGWEVGTGAADVFRAFSAGYSAAADRAAAEALARIESATELAAGTAAIAARNPEAAPMAALHAEQREMTVREAGARAADAEAARAELAQVAEAPAAPAETAAEAPAGAGEGDAQDEAPDVYTLPFEAYTPALDSDPDGDLLISHNHEDGTTLEGSTRGDGAWEIVKAHRFECRRGVIFIRNSRDRFADLVTIDKAAKALRDAGHTVTVEIDDVWRPASEREEARGERASARAVRLSDRAVRHYGEADSRREASRRIGDLMPFGEPIKIGHHSERAHRRAFERIEAHTRASIAAWDYAQHLANRAAGAEANEAAKHDPRAIMRRIERIEAEGRQWARRLAEAIEGGAAGYARRAMLEAEKIAEDVAYQRAKLGDLAAAGAFVAWSRESVQRGDLVKVGGRWCEVARVNQKGVSVYARFEWSGSDRAQPVTWDEIFGRRRDGLQWETPNGEPWSIAEAARVATWRNLVRLAAVTSYDRSNEQEERQRRNTARARRLVLGLNYDATPQEVEAYGEPADEKGKRARALACLAVFERLEAGEKLADVARSVQPIGDTVPRWTMPAAAPVEVRARELVPGDIVAGVYDDFFGKRRLVRSIVGPVTAPTTERDRHESGEYAYLTVDGETHEMKAWRLVAAHLVGPRSAFAATE